MFRYLIISSAVCLFQSSALAETLLQHEKLSLDKCITVIEVTSKNLGIEPDIIVDTNTVRIAEYQLIDGILKIECDGELGDIRVFSN